MTASDVLLEIAQQAAECQLCELHHSRKNAVPGEGPADAEIMLVGEGPGFHENEQGRPFVGAAGKFLEELLASIDLSRESVFITNVVKCRPPGNRDPQIAELEACQPYLERQIQAINPKAIVTLGRFSMATFIPNAKISQIHGNQLLVNGRMIVPMFHPAAALHQPSLRPLIEADFKKLPGMIAGAGNKADDRGETPASTGDPEQLSLF